MQPVGWCVAGEKRDPFDSVQVRALQVTGLFHVHPVEECLAAPPPGGSMWFSRGRREGPQRGGRSGGCGRRHLAGARRALFRGARGGAPLGAGSAPAGGSWLRGSYRSRPRHWCRWEGPQRGEGERGGASAATSRAPTSPYSEGCGGSPPGADSRAGGGLLAGGLRCFSGRQLSRPPPSGAPPPAVGAGGGPHCSAAAASACRSWPTMPAACVIRGGGLEGRVGHWPRRKGRWV